MRKVLTISVLAEMIVGGERRFTDAGLVHGFHSEGVDHVLLQSADGDFRLVVGGLLHFDPFGGEFVFHLDDIVEDGAAAVVLRRGPFQVHSFVVVVDDLGSAGGSGLVCGHEMGFVSTLGWI